MDIVTQCRIIFNLFIHILFGFKVAGEFDNLAGDPTHGERIAEMHAILVAELGEEPDQAELRCRADYKVGYERS